MGFINDEIVSEKGEFHCHQMKNIRYIGVLKTI